MTYEYLKEYIYNKGTKSTLFNSFYPVTSENILEAESMLKVLFPSELRQFYEEIGYGYLQASYADAENVEYVFYSSNLILHPEFITDIYKNVECDDAGNCYTKSNHNGGYCISPSTFESLSPGDLPVFEIADSSSFMIMKTMSDNPNAVWYMGYEKIEDSFEQFIYNLYYDDPAYYSRGWADEYMKDKN
jgi:hypothetical protein